MRRAFLITMNNRPRYIAKWNMIQALLAAPLVGLGIAGLLHLIGYG